ncbi:TetR/AcrR family transcriptional regulator [Saccharomonospora saliphila]|uniref:TetR/AcrR family transcriptional regulator n=1 Tax=Saccharomonospora saliphila TaxID=369829 RepID=UPI00036F34F1|nr:TetR/AcrR family transcriptional regulator [Saccharomonospora saliphila]
MPVNTPDEFAAGLGLTPTEAARRTQIIDATTEVVADEGYDRASFARIVARAGLSSTRMISYHFAGKAELMTATLTALADEHDRFVAERVPSTGDRAESLRWSIEAEIAFLAERFRQSRALTEIARHARDGDGARLGGALLHDLRVGRLERQLHQGRQEGVFGTFDVKVMALAIRQAIDGVCDRLADEPGLDPRTYAAELTRLFARATSAP